MSNFTLFDTCNLSKSNSEFATRAYLGIYAAITPYFVFANLGHAVSLLVFMTNREGSSRTYTSFFISVVGIIQASANTINLILMRMLSILYILEFRGLQNVTPACL